MSDAASLRNLLKRADMSAPSIQGSAGAMMKHYDKSANVAVVEWRNALHQARPDQHLPLLYVANEVLQNSKRNRGNKFLEAFSPVLGQSLIFICQKQNAASVERVRRTVKIWGDRHVFSVRYVNELLKGLEPYRTGGGSGGGHSSRKPSPSPRSPQGQMAGFSPVTRPPKSPEAPEPPNKVDIDRELAIDEDGLDDGAESDDGDLFGDSGTRLLDINVDMDRAAASVEKGNKANNNTAAMRKRRRSSTGSNSGGTSKTHSRRKSVLSTNSLMELWSQVAELQQSFDHVETLLADITPEYLDEASVTEQIDTLVGDELLAEYKKVIMYEKRVVDQRKELHNIANKRKFLEKDAVRYLPWLELQLKQDKDDIEFCEKVQKQIQSFQHVHALAKAARNERLEEEARRQREQEEMRQKKEEEEERKKFSEMAMSKVTEAKPGMVWNKATQEYQYRETDESWRD